MEKDIKPLRLLPGIIIVVIQLFLRYIVPMLSAGDTAATAGALGPMAGGLAVIIWWAFFSRADGWDRLTGTLLMILGLALTPRTLHISIRTGMAGMMFYILALTPLCLAFVTWAVLARHARAVPRRVSMAVVILAGCGGWGLFRSDGITGHAGVNLAWRWSRTAEARLLAGDVKAAVSLTVDDSLQGDWPGFRGTDRTGVVTGLKVGSDWDRRPPREVWRRPVGPGCSSFAVKGRRIFTQEQRGEEEAVSCYDLGTGQTVWMHTYRARFYDSHAGAGPRGTPTLHDSCVYALGATGILYALRAGDGSVIWSRNVVDDTDVKIPGWGVASSPLVTGPQVIVAAVGKMAAYDKDTGNLRWTGPDGGNGYSSPHLLTVAGVPQVVLMADSGITAHTPETGKLLWSYPLGGEHIIQPCLLPDGDFLFDAAGKGMHRLTPAREDTGWSFTEKWVSRRLKATFNDIVVHRGHAYGFNGQKLVCIRLSDGERAWSGGRYGGQLLLLADQGLLLILSEKGSISLVAADPAAYRELAGIPAIEGKTWNHPALAGNILLVRNTKEMAAFRLPAASAI